MISISYLAVAVLCISISLDPGLDLSDPRINAREVWIPTARTKTRHPNNCFPTKGHKKMTWVD